MEKQHHPGLGLFILGLFVGGAMGFGMGTEEGRRWSRKLTISLEKMLRNLKEAESAPSSTGHYLPGPPTPTEMASS